VNEHSTTQYNREQMNDLLAAGAQQIDRWPVYAAIHLLTFTDLPGRPHFTDLVDIEDTEDTEDTDGPVAAFVRDWKALPDTRGLGSGSQRLLALAASLATGDPVDLSANVCVGGHAHARRVIEAIAIATGYGEMYEVRPTTKLDEMLAAQDALLA
jgi:hypothetical protein